MGIFSSTSPNNVKSWLLDQSKNATYSMSNLLEQLPALGLSREQIAKMLPFFHQFFTNMTQILDFASETKQWRDEIPLFIMKNGPRSIDAFLFLLSENTPPTPENLAEAMEDIDAREVKEIHFNLGNSYISVKKSFNDLVLENHALKGHFLGSINMNVNYGENFERRGGVEMQIKVLKIEGNNESEKAIRVFKLCYEYLLGNLKWSRLVREGRIFNVSDVNQNQNEE